MLFQAPQDVHWPAQRGATAPQDWQTNALEVLAIESI